MSLITNNSSHSVLGPNRYFLGNTIKPEHKYITIQLTLEYTGSASGLLEVFHSMDGIYYDTYGDSWTYNSLDGACHAFRETQIKGSYFYVKFTNTGTTTQTSFNLHTKITPYTSTVAVDGVINIPTVQVDIDGETVFSRIRDSNNNNLTSTTGYLNTFEKNNIIGFSLEETQLDIKGKTDSLTFNNNNGTLELNVFDVQNNGKLDSIKTNTSRLKADTTYTDAIQVAIKNNTLDVSGSVIVPHLSKSTDSVDISGQKVDISGQSIVVPHLSKSTDSVDISGQKVDISGQTVVVAHLSKATDSVDISGQSVVVPHLSKSTDSVDISGQKVDISGQSIVVPHLSKSTDSVDISGQKVDISGQTVVVAHLSKATDSVDISGQNVVVPHLSKSTDSVDISGQKVDISGQSIVVPYLNKSTDSVDISGQKVDISGQTVVVAHLSKSTDSVDISGQKVDISGQKMDISGQTVVVAHLSKSTDSVDISGQTVNIGTMPAISISSVNIKDSSGSNIYADTSGNIKTNIQNTSLDTHCYGSSNGTTWHHLSTDSNGQLNVHSKTQDGAGTDITSTVVNSKTGLDVNIAGGSSTSLIKDSSGNSISAQVSGAAYAGYLNTYNPHLANATLDNSITTINKSILSGSSPNMYLTNRCNGLGDQYVVLSTNGGGNTVAFDNTSNNNKVKIDASNNTVSFASGQSVGITSSSNTVKIGDASNDVLTLSPTQHDATKIAADTNAHMVGYSRTDSGYNTATLVRPYTSNSSANSVRAVESYSYNVCLNNTSNLYLPITSTTTDTTQSMDTFINNSSTINDYATTGLNMYQIYPKRKTYQLSGIASAGALNTMLSSFGTSTTFSAVSWGQTALKTFYASMGAGGTTKYLRFEYVDSNGDLQTTGTVGVGTGSGTTPLLSSIVGINRIYFASAVQSGANNQAFGTADSLYVSTTSGSTTPSYYGGQYYGNWNSTYTCPNFKVAILKNFAFYATSGSDVFVFVCDSTGGRRMLLSVINASNFIYQVVDLQINPGETLFFGTGNNTTPLNKQVFAQIYQYDV